MEKMNALATPNSDLQLMADMKDGQIHTNIDDLKLKLQDMATSYALVQYSDDVDDKMRQMKSDRKNLNAFADSIDSVRKRIKAEIMKPYTEFEVQVKELLMVVDEPKSTIDKKIKEMEAERKLAKKAEIRTFYDSISGNVPLDFVEQLYAKVYDEKWENASATKKEYKDALTSAVQNYTNGMFTLSMMTSDFLEEGMEKFRETLNLTEAIAFMNEKQKQKEEMLRKEQERIERERIRMEEEARRKAEAAAEERMRIERERIKAENDARLEMERQKLKEEREEMEAEKKRQEQELAAEKQKVREQALREAALREEQAKATAETVEPAYAKITSPYAQDASYYGNSTRVSNVQDTGNSMAGPKAGMVTVSMKEEDWAIVKKYAERMNISYRTIQ